ncbi:hypothetical protein BH09BAC1_BH09BAC1_08600 [soil metagenome]
MKTLLLSLIFFVSIGVLHAQGLSVTVTADTSICTGDTLTLEAVVTGGTAPYSYKWSPAAGLECDTCPTTLAFPTDSIIYMVVVTDSNLLSDTGYVTVGVDTASIVSGSGLFSIRVFGDTLDYEADSISFSFDSSMVGRWSGILENQRGSINDSVNYFGATYTYKSFELKWACGGVKAYWDCEMDVNICFQPTATCVRYCLDTTILIGKLHGGVGFNNTLQMQVYPIPANNSIRLSNDIYRQATIQFFNTLGILVLQKKVQVLADAEIELSTLSPGVYYMHVNTVDGHAIHKMVKE